MPGASSLIAELPRDGQELGPDGIPVRDRLLLDMLYAGFSPAYEWTQVVSAGPQGVLRLMVGADALKIGDDDDSVRINLSQLALQEFCDRQDCCLLTPKICDLRWLQAGVRPPPSTISPYPASSTAAMVQHSRMVDSHVPRGLSPNIIIGNVGKGAVNSTLLWRPPNPTHMAIYGWHGGPSAARQAVVEAAGLIVQPESIRHVAYFVDYSATGVVMRREAEYTNDQGTTVIDVAEAAKDPVLCQLVSHAGPVILRHPGVLCPMPEAGNGPLPPACPVPDGPLPPSAGANTFPTWPIVVGGVAMGLAVAYVATR